MESIFENITNYLCCSRLDRIRARLIEAGVTKEVMMLLDDYIDSYINLMTLHVNLAYKQGMKDLAAFIVGLYNVNVDGQQAAASENES